MRGLAFGDRPHARTGRSRLQATSVDPAGTPVRTVLSRTGRWANLPASQQGDAILATIDERPAIAPEAGTPDQPVRASERILSLDLIRGVAVLGILFANITDFGQPNTAYWWPDAMTGGPGASDKLVWLFQLIFVDHKFRGLFSVLFGAGIYLFTERAWARGSGRWLQLRRLLWLMAFGLIHYYLIWHGDILTAYAVTGILALPFLTLSAKAQMRWGIGLYVVGFLFMTLAVGGQYLAATNTAVAAQMTEEQREEVSEAPGKMLEDAGKEVTVFRDSSYPELVEHTVTTRSDDLAQELILVPLFETLALMLLGMALYRRGFFSGEWDPAKMRRWGWIGIVGGLLLTAPVALWPYLTGFPFFTTLFAFQALGRIGQLPIALGLAALLVVHAPRILQTGLGSRLAAAGRMAFSNYLGTSILMMLVFHGWALGLYGSLHRLQLMLVVLAVWAAMLLWSKWWLERYRYGPLEWLWRCLTYWKIFALRR